MLEILILRIFCLVIMSNWRRFWWRLRLRKWWSCSS